VPATTASIKWRFETPYKGGTKVWSTTFHLTGGDWQDQTHFNTFADNMKAYIYVLITARTTLLDATGYNPGSDVPVFTKSYNVACTQSRGTSWLMPLEAAILLRWTTDQRSTKNHPIYLYNYIHDIYSNSATTPEVPDASLISTWTSRCATFITGITDGSLTRKRAGPRGAVAQTGAAEAYAVHRDFPR
jgi:hypothetical protein